MSLSLVAKPTLSRSRKRRRFLLLLLGVSLVSGTATGLRQREIRVRDEYASVAEFIPGNSASLRARIAALESLADRYPLSAGGFRADRELHDLRVELVRLEQEEEEKERQVADAEAQALSEAETHVVKGLDRAEAGDLVAARMHFTRALELDMPEWEKRAEVERDLEAIEAELSRAQNGEPAEGQR